MVFLFYFGGDGQDLEAQRAPRVCLVQLIGVTGAYQ